MEVQVVQVDDNNNEPEEDVEPELDQQITPEMYGAYRPTARRTISREQRRNRRVRRRTDFQ